MRFGILFLALLGALNAPLAARADVVNAGPGSFAIHAERSVAAPPGQVWGTLLHVERWWNSAHTYSGDAHNLMLTPRAGGCWCEHWAHGSVEHGRVLMVMDHEGTHTLRLAAALGPLQQLGVSAILTFTVTPDASGTKITMDYRVAGDSGLALESIASRVNDVLMEQFDRLAQFNPVPTP